VYEILKKTTV